MHFNLHLTLGALSILATQAQEIRGGVASAIRNPIQQYNTTNARLSEIRSDYVRNGLTYTENCNNTFVRTIPTPSP